MYPINDVVPGLPLFYVTGVVCLGLTELVDAN